MKKPNFFIVGAPKCGTTSMANYLAGHPQIFMPEEKEPHFFGSDLDFPATVKKKYLQNRDRYLSLFKTANQEKMLGEASTWYLYSQKAAAEINEFCPSAKIIIMLRNPVDMIYSQYNYNLAAGREDITSFEEALVIEDNRTHIPNCLYEFPLHILAYRKIARFSGQIERYLNTFSRENIHFIILDDFKKNSTEVYKDVLGFLEVDQNYTPDFVVHNATLRRKVRSKALQKLARKRFVKRIVLAFNPRWDQGPLSWMIRLYGKINYKYDDNIPAMNLQTQISLKKEFKEEVQKLSTLLNRDFTHWIE